MKKQPEVIQRIMDYLKNIDFYEKLVDEMEKDIKKKLWKSKDSHSQI